jgi:hypothetical protein
MALWSCGALRQGRVGDTADQLIQGHRHIIGRAHANGLEVFDGAVTGLGGALHYYPGGAGERQALNDFIRARRVRGRGTAARVQVLGPLRELPGAARVRLTDNTPRLRFAKGGLTYPLVKMEDW